MSGRVKKPCPGCHTTDHHRNSADGVCSECQRNLEFAAATRERQNVMADTEIEVMTVERAYAITDYYAKDSRCSPDHDTRARFRTAFHTLIQLLSRPSNKEKYYYNEKETQPVWVPKQQRDWQQRMVMDKKKAEALCELDEAARAMVISTAEVAHEQGRNLLAGLASGEVSVQEYNKRTIKGES